MNMNDWGFVGVVSAFFAGWVLYVSAPILDSDIKAAGAAGAAFVVGLLVGYLLLVERKEKGNG